MRLKYEIYKEKKINEDFHHIRKILNNTGYLPFQGNMFLANDMRGHPEPKIPNETEKTLFQTLSSLLEHLCTLTTVIWSLYIDLVLIWILRSFTLILSQTGQDVRQKRLKYEPPHDKTNKLACAPNEDSDQPGHPPSLIRVFTVRMKKASFLSYPLSAQRRLWSDWADAQADLSLRWAHTHFVGFFTRQLILF